MAGFNIDEFYAQHSDALYAFLIHLTHNEADSKDIFQAVFLKIAQKPSLISGKRNPRAFLIRMAHNAWIDQIRRETNRSRLNEKLSLPTLLEAPEPNDDSLCPVAVSTALQSLPENQRMVIHLKIWEEMSFREISAVLDISPNTAASRYRYGLDKLSQLIRLHQQQHHLKSNNQSTA